MNKNIIIMAFILIGVLVILSVFFMKSKSTPPQIPYPIDDPNVEYLISKKNEKFVIKYLVNFKEYIVYVGNSNVDLEQYLNKKVIIQGEYPKKDEDIFKFESNTQCIQGKCSSIFDSENTHAIVVNITNLRLSDK